MDKKTAARLRKNDRVAWSNWQDAVMAGLPQQAIDQYKDQWLVAHNALATARRLYPFLFPPIR